MKIATFILARAGSKRIPGKNKKNFCGRPLIEWTVRTAVELGYPVYLMSDDDDIKRKINKWYCGVYVLTMPEKYAGDVHDVRGSLEYINGYAGADIIVLLQPTSPVRSTELVTAWVSDFVQTEYEVGISAYPLQKYAYNQSGERLDQVERTGNEHPLMFIENGGFYVFKKEALNRRHITDGPRRLYPDVVDVELDTAKDWKKLETLVNGGYYNED